MQSLSRSCQASRLLFVAQTVGWFVAFYFYVLLRIRPELFYQQKPDVFLFDSYFFAGYLDRPGGLVEYASAFLSPLFALDWLGSLVVTLLTALICLATRRIITALTAQGDWTLFLLPAVPILMVLGRYNHPVSLLVGLSAVLLLTCLYVGVGRMPAAVRFTVFVIASALAYYAAAGLYAVFAVLCGIVEWRIHGRRWLAAMCVLSAVLVPMGAGVWLCHLNVQAAYRGILIPAERYWLAMPSSASISQAILAVLLLLVPAIALAVGWRRRRAGASPVPPETQSETATPEGAPEDARRPVSALRLALQSAALAVLAIAADLLLLDSSTKHTLLVAYSAEREQWADVLTYARSLPPSDAWNLFQVNRALYHRGELLDRMFAYPQVADSPSTLTLQFKNLLTTVERASLDCSDLFFELGRVNESQHMAYESLEMFGERPHTLERLFCLHVIKGEPEAARKFLAVLQRSLLHCDWAEDYLGQLDADPTLADVPLVASRRALMLQRDFAGKLDAETMLSQLLERNPRNRMALEYLMAYYLLTRQLDKMAANLYRFEDLGQTRLPRYCEEAILVYLDAARSPARDQVLQRISAESRRRGAEFGQAFARHQGNLAAAFAALEHDFGDSYFFFYVFGHNDRQFAKARPS